MRIKAYIAVIEVAGEVREYRIFASKKIEGRSRAEEVAKLVSGKLISFIVL